MKRIFAIALALVLALASFAALAEGTQEIRIGTSNFYFTAPADYVKGEMSAEDTNLGQVAYYFTENSLVDFDLYYWAKATDETLESAIAEETEGEIASAEFGGVAFLYYYTEEEADGETFKTVTYMAEDGEYFVELVFWLDGEDAEAKVGEMMNTIAVKEDTDAKTGEGLIRLGTSDLYVTAAKAYEKGEMLRADTDECQVAYFCSEETTLDFDVYYWAKGTEESLESNAAEEAAAFETEAADREINGIATKYYYAEEQVEGEETSYRTLTYIIDDGEYLAEIVFWLDGETAEAEAEAIISSLNH